MEARGARSLGEVDRAYELAAQIYGPNYLEARSNFAHARLLEPLQNLEDAVVIVDNDEILGFVRILDRNFNSPIGAVRAGGITSVCVHPDLQGKGWGLKVMEAALRRSHERGDALSVLFARRAVDGWYSKLGYVGIGCHPECTVDGNSAGRVFQNSAASFRTGTVPQYLSFYRHAYQSSYQDLFLSMVRNEDWWQTLDQRLARRVKDSEFINVELGEHPIGYFILKEGRVIEVASLPDQRENLASALVHFHLQQDGKGPILTLPLRHWCLDRMAIANHTMSVRYSWDGGHMVRIMDKKVFRSIVAPCATKETSQLLDKIFDRYNVAQNFDALHLLLTVCGAMPESPEKLRPTHGGLSQSLIPDLPTWSAVDGL